MANADITLPEPAWLKTSDDTYNDDTASKWAWFAHGYDTGMEPFFSAEQLRAAILSERERIVALLEALGPKEPNDVWESAYKHVIGDCIKAISGERDDQ